MARDGGVSCLWRSEMMNVGGKGGIESTPLDLDEVHVLAVDDSLVDRIVIERLLRITSCKVTAVDSGWRALEFLGLDNEKASAELDRLKVDLIITDYCMPGMTGYELLKKIKESSNFRQVPVVIMSSENILPRIDRCLEEGAEDFLLKPVKLADVKRLRNYLSKDINVNNGNKRKVPEDSVSVNSTFPQPLTTSPETPLTTSESLDSVNSMFSKPLTTSPETPLTISESLDSVNSTFSQPLTNSSETSSPMTTSESSDSSPPLSPGESCPSSPIDDDVVALRYDGGR